MKLGLTKRQLLGVAICGVLAGGVFAIWRLPKGPDITVEFSPNLLKFRTRTYALGLCVGESEWTTELLEECRHAVAEQDKAISSNGRWDIAYARFGREKSRGDAIPAYSFFCADMGVTVYSSLNEADRKRFLCRMVHEFRDGRYSTIYEEVFGKGGKGDGTDRGR